jgi:hypothetical protein
VDSGGDTLAEYPVAAALEREADDNITAVPIEVPGEQCLREGLMPERFATWYR